MFNNIFRALFFFLDFVLKVDMTFEFKLFRIYNKIPIVNIS